MKKNKPCIVYTRKKEYKNENNLNSQSLSELIKQKFYNIFTVILLVWLLSFVIKIAIK